MNENSIATGKYVKQTIANLTKEIPQRMREKNIPGLSMAWVSREGTMWTGCFGYTDMTKVQEVNVETLFGLSARDSAYSSRRRNI